MERVARWAGLEDGGLEHLSLRVESERVVADAIVIGDASAPFGLSYRLTCDGDWRVREVQATLVGADRAISLRSDGHGRWSDAAGQPVPMLDACIDVDIAATPFTNTLPIRRLGLRPGESRDIRAAYLAVPSLELAAVSQRYTRLDASTYRYEGFPPGFSADITVDADGLVVEYPGLFRRVVRPPGKPA